MARSICAKGHEYDSEYGICPICNRTSNFMNFESGNFGKTVMPANMVPPAVTPPAGAAFEYAPVYPAGSPIEATVAPEGYTQPGKTVSEFASKSGFDPVVGWLVCTEGVNRGKSYELFSKINTIGRGKSMDVTITGDDTISRENHAKLAYDPKHVAFQLIPAESVNNIYLNDEAVYVPAKLKAYDVIELGKHKLVFVPFCCENFDWSDAEK